MTRNNIFFGKAQKMEKIEDNSIDLIVTSPPYPMIEMWDEILINQNNKIKTEFEKGGMTEEQKIAKEEELENQKIQDLIKTIISNNDKQEKYRLISDIYSNILGDEERKIKYFESELNKLAPEILKTNILHKLFNIILRLVGGIAFMVIWVMLFAKLIGVKGAAYAGLALGAFIVFNPWIKSWINPFRLKNAERFRFGKKLW